MRYKQRFESLVGIASLEARMWDHDDNRDEDDGTNRHDASVLQERRHQREIAAKHKLLLVRQLTTGTHWVTSPSPQPSLSALNVGTIHLARH